MKAMCFLLSTEKKNTVYFSSRWETGTTYEGMHIPSPLHLLWIYWSAQKVVYVETNNPLMKIAAAEGGTIHKDKWGRYVPGLGEKFCNGPVTEFVYSPYHFFNFWYCKFYLLDIYISFYHPNRIIFAINIFPSGRKTSWLKEIKYIIFSYLNRIIFTIIVFLFGREISTPEKYNALKIESWCYWMLFYHAHNLKHQRKW